jgi:hypothetical protein
MKKGKIKFRITQVPDETSSYATHAMSKLISPSLKRLASELDESTINNAQNTTTTAPTQLWPQEQPKLPNPQPTRNRELETIEENITDQNNRLSRLEDCCSKLADTTQVLALQMSTMNANVNQKFQEIAVQISNIKLSPNRKSSKAQKGPDPSIDPDL